jgi:hypothetical protein
MHCQTLLIKAASAAFGSYMTPIQVTSDAVLYSSQITPLYRHGLLAPREAAIAVLPDSQAFAALHPTR